VIAGGFSRRSFAVTATLAVVLAVGCLVADLTMAPATSDGASIVYVDAVMGRDSADGSTPALAKRTIGAGLAAAGPGTEVLVTGYGVQAIYRQYLTGCVTLRGEPGRPIVIRANPFQRRLRPLDVTTTLAVVGTFVRSADERASGAGVAWSVPWRDDPRMGDDTGVGLVKMGQVAFTGYPGPPATGKPYSAWWSQGRLYLRVPAGVDPNRYPVQVRQGAGFCLSGDSAHAVIRNAQVIGAVRTVEVMPGARDIDVSTVYGQQLVTRPLVPADSLPTAPAVSGP
jgi:hypothetical protein